MPQKKGSNKKTASGHVKAEMQHSRPHKQSIEEARESEARSPRKKSSK